MGYLEKKMIMHERDDNQKLLPIDYPCTQLGGTVLSVLPASRGKIMRKFREAKTLLNSGDKKGHDKALASLASEHILDHKTGKPMYTVEELTGSAMKAIRYVDKEGKPTTYEAWDLFVTIVYEISGIDIKEKDSSKGAVEGAEEDLKKKPNNSVTS